MSRFATLAGDTVGVLLGMGFCDHPVPARFARASRTEQRGELQLRTRRLAHPERGELRLVTIVSPRIDIITLFCFPAPAQSFPVFAMELVVLGPRPVLGAIDLVDLSDTTSSRQLARDWLAQAHRRFPLPAAGDPPDWYQSCRSGSDFFVRPSDEGELTGLCEAHTWLWACYTRHWPQALALDGPGTEQHARRQRNFRHHHRDHSPGLRLLARSFGDAWTREYLHDWLFA